DLKTKIVFIETPEPFTRIRQSYTVSLLFAAIFAAVQSRPVVFNADQQAPALKRCVYEYTAGRRIFRHSVPDGVFDNRLKNKGGHLRVQSLRLDVHFHDEAFLKADLFDSKICL